MCPTCPRGHGAFNSSTAGSRNSSTPVKRSNRKVSGGAYGKPNLATMKPLLHNNTKNTGNGDKNAAAGADTAREAEGLDMLSVLGKSNARRRAWWRGGGVPV